MLATQAINGFLDDLVRSQASRPTQRQRAWALREALTAAALAQLHGPAPTSAQIAATAPDALDKARTAVPASALTDPHFSTWFLPWAAQGQLSVKNQGTSAAAARARAATLRAFAAYQNTPGPRHTHPAPAPRQVPPPRTATRMLAVLTEHAPATPATIRLAALAAVLEHDPAGPAQICAMTRTHVHAEPDQVTLIGPSGNDLTLTGHASAAMNAWLDQRATLVSALTGSPHDALWVAVRPHMTPEGHVRPAGLPLHPRGLERAWSAGVTRLNAHLDAHPELSYDPSAPYAGLPTSLDLLRRALSA